MSVAEMTLSERSRLAHIAGNLVAMGPPSGTARAMIRAAGVDTMGCVLLGANHPAAQQARAALAPYQGRAPVFGTGQASAAPFAALCNGTAAHAYEFDDWEALGNTHPSAVLFPALWAIAAERGASGAALAGAYTAGFEVIARLGQAFNFEHYNNGWHSTATLGAIGAAAAVSRLLNLDVDGMTHALSLAITQASGYTCQFGSEAKALHAGLGARDGLMAALWAEQGLAGQAAVLDAPTGFAALMSHGDLTRLDDALSAMNGQALADWGLILKPYPSCGYNHRLVTCALALAGELDIAEVQRIEATLPDFHYAIQPYDWPTTRAESLFSAPFCIASALRYGRLELAHFTEQARADPTTKVLLAKVEVRTESPRRPSTNYDPEQPDRLIVTLKSGQSLSASCAYPLGAPQNPMSLADVRRKFESIAGPVEVSALDRLLQWDSADDINAILTPFEGET